VLFWGRRIGSIEIQQLQARCLEALLEDVRESLEQLIAEMVIFLAFGSQALAIQGNGAGDLHGPAIKMPIIGRNQPRPTDDLSLCNRLNRERASFSAVNLQRDLAVADDIKLVGFITFTKEPMVRYFMDGNRAGQQVDASGFDWIRTSTTLKQRTGVVTAREAAVSPDDVVVTSVSQNQLPELLPDGQTFNLTINGSGFGDSPTVSISGFTVTVLSAADDVISISLTTPGGTPATAPVVLSVTNPDTNRTTTRSGLFTLVPEDGTVQPDIVSVSPSRGTSDVFPVTISGADLGDTGTATVVFGTTAMPIIDAAGDGTWLRVGFPAGGLPATGPLDVIVRTGSGKAEDILPDGFEYINNVQGPGKVVRILGCGAVPGATKTSGLTGDALTLVAVVLLLAAFGGAWRGRRRMS